MLHLIAQALTRDFRVSSFPSWAADLPRPSKSGAVPVVHHALRMLAAGAAWRIRATLVVILAALRRISDAIGGSKSSGAKQHGRRDQRNE